MSAIIMDTQQKLAGEYLPVRSEKLKRLQLTKGGKIIGWIDFEKRIYFTRKQIFRNFEGLSLSESVIAVLENYKIYDICYDNLDRTYRTVLQKFYLDGQEYIDNVGGDKQLVLSLKHFK